MDLHFCRHDSTDKIFCDYCDQTFQSNELTKCLRHLETAHADDRTMYQCQKCPQYFGMAKLKDFHEKYFPHPKKRYRCDICSRRYSSKKLIESHMERVHIGTQSFRSSWHLPLLLKTRFFLFRAGGNKRSFLCSECGKGFAAKRNLEHHTLLHGEPTIQCPSCPAKFHRQKIFELHFQWHQNLIFKCKKCDYTCSIKATLANHISELVFSLQKATEL